MVWSISGQWLNARSGRSWLKKFSLSGICGGRQCDRGHEPGAWILGAGTVWLPIGLLIAIVFYLLFTRMPALVGKAMLAVIVLLPAFVYPWTPMPAAGGESFGRTASEVGKSWASSRTSAISTTIG